MLSGSVTVTVGALSAILRSHEIGELPLVLRADPVWTDDAGTRNAAQAAVQEFIEVGWTNGRGHLDPDVLDALYVLTHATTEYFAIILAVIGNTSAIVAARGDEAVIGYRVGNAVTLSFTRNASLPEALLRQIPDSRPAPIEAVNIRTDQLPASFEGINAVMADGDTADDRDMRTLASLTRQKLLAHGELYVAIRNRHNQQRRSDPIRYRDYRTGRIVLTTTSGYLSVAPATKVFLRDQLRAIHHDLAER